MVVHGLDGERHAGHEGEGLDEGAELVVLVQLVVFQRPAVELTEAVPDLFGGESVDGHFCSYVTIRLDPEPSRTV